jgi:hypothetical protein
MKVVKNDFTKFSFHHIGKAPSNPLNLIQRELLQYRRRAASDGAEETSVSRLRYSFV